MSAFIPSAGLYLRFRSKIDAWLGGVVLLGILLEELQSRAAQVQRRSMRPRMPSIESQRRVNLAIAAAVLCS